MKTIYKRLTFPRARVIRIVIALVFAAALGPPLLAYDQAPWIAPEESKAMKNPVPSSHENLAAGEQLYSDNCVICHGDKGHGDGIGIKMLTVMPGDLTDPKLMAQETDGSLFWKISSGRAPMPAWKDTLTESQRWTLVNYIRKLGADAATAPSAQ